MMKIEYQSIGVIYTPWQNIEDMPIQPIGGKGAEGRVEVFPAYEEGLKDLDGFSHIVLLYHLHQAKSPNLSVIPFMDTVSRGVFATRAPSRPNSIGLSVVQLNRIEGCSIQVQNLDILNGTPLLDIKPYIRTVDDQEQCRFGWLEHVKNNFRTKRSDNRFQD
jgi:tRNA-Thr(GGU) m(6)t(6)A37 methyltransferase TsaA